MRYLLIVFMIAGTAGCGAEQVKQALTNIDRDCSREYVGSLGGTWVGSTVSFRISCQPSGTVTTTTVTVPPKVNP